MQRAFNVTSSRAAEKFVVRFPDAMRDRIAKTARENDRSMNSEIIMRLDLSLTRDGVPGNPVVDPDDAQLSLHEHELLMQFRQLSRRQQNALLSLIERDANSDL